MFRTFANVWNKLKEHIILYATLLALLFASFQLGVSVGEKSIEEKEASYIQNEKLLLQAANFEKESLKNKLSSLMSQVVSLKENKAELKEKVHSVEAKYDKLVLRLQEISVSYNSLEELKEKTIKEKRKLENVIANSRPFLDYKIKLNSNNEGVSFTVYNKSEIPLKIIETDYQSWSNGVRGRKHTGVYSTILYPDKNNIVFSFSHDKMPDVKSGKIDWRGGVCAKYTTLNKQDIRYWVYEIWFIYDSENEEFDVVRTMDNGASSKKHCDLEKMRPSGWVKN